MNEDPNANQSWVSEGNLTKMLDTFSEFPSWVTSIFKSVTRQLPLTLANFTRHSSDLGLWQLRDIVSWLCVSSMAH